MTETTTRLRGWLIAALMLAAGIGIGVLSSPQTKERGETAEPRKARNPLEASIWAAEDVEAMGFPQEFDPANHGDWASFFVTNIDHHMQPAESTIHFPIKRYIYFYDQVLYSQKFADRYGYPATHVAELNDGLHLIEFKMQTEGWITTCKFSFLIDRSFGLYLPSEQFYLRPRVGNSQLGSPIILPKRQDGYVERAEDRRFRLEYREGTPGGRAKDFVYQNAFLSGQDYVPEPGKPGSLTSVRIQQFSPNLYKGLNYLVVETGCTQLSWATIKAKDSQFWFLSRDAVESGQRGKQDAADFFRFRIPDSLKHRVVPMMKTQIQNTERDRKKIVERYYDQ